MLALMLEAINRVISFTGSIQRGGNLVRLRCKIRVGIGLLQKFSDVFGQEFS